MLCVWARVSVSERVVPCLVLSVSLVSIAHTSLLHLLLLLFVLLLSCLSSLPPPLLLPLHSSILQAHYFDGEIDDEQLRYRTPSPAVNAERGSPTNSSPPLLLLDPPPLPTCLPAPLHLPLLCLALVRCSRRKRPRTRTETRAPPLHPP